MVFDVGKLHLSGINTTFLLHDVTVLPLHLPYNLRNFYLRYTSREKSANLYYILSALFPICTHLLTQMLQNQTFFPQVF
jgi:hypothetical protein